VGAAAALAVSALVPPAVARRWPTALGAVLVAIVAADLLVFDAAARPGIASAGPPRAPLPLEAIAWRAGRLAPDGDWPPRVGIVPIDPNQAMLARLAVVQGYSPVAPRGVTDVLGQSLTVAAYGVLGDERLAAPANRALDLLRCRMVVVPEGAPIPLVRAIAAGGPRWARVATNLRPGLAAWENRDALPVAWLVGAQRVVSPAEALRLVHHGRAAGERFDPRAEALTERPIPGVAIAGPEPRPVAGGIRVVSYDADELRLATDAPAPGLLVTSERAHPGWQAALDGAPVPIHTVNGGFRAVVVPAGRHEVTFVYRSVRARLGFGVAALALAGIAGCALAARPRLTRRRPFHRRAR
jgi:hypothetical protein